MNNKLKILLKYLIQHPDDVVNTTQITEFRNQIDFISPNDYFEAVLEFNGAEGKIGKNSYLILFPLQKLIETNINYSLLMNEIPDYFLIGMDAADTGYAINKKNLTYHSFGLMSDFKTDAIEFCGNNFLEFIEFLYSQ